MAALNFPNSPSLNDTHTENGVTFKWNGAAWDRLGDIGAQGSAGAAGAQGSAGAQGVTGPVAGSSSQVVYKDSSNNPAGSANFTFDGTNLTVSGNVSIGGTLTYEDVTNIDSVGVVTARAGVKVPDSQKIFLGTGDDLRIYHDGSINRIRSDVLTVIEKNDSEDMASFMPDGAVVLFHNGNNRFETTSTGASVTGNLNISGHTYLNDNRELVIGAGQDLKLYHDASNSRIKNVTGQLWLQSDNGIRFTDSGVNESMAAFYDNGAVELYYDGSKKLETTTTGANVTGDFIFGANSKAKLFENGTQSGVQATNSGSSSHLMTHDGNEDIHVDPSGYIKFEVAGSERLRITSAGDVGIGTAVPITSSGFGNLSLAKTNGGQVEFKKLSSGRTHYIWGDDNLNIGASYNGGGGGLIFKTNGNNERLRINGDGRVSIGGVTSPLGALHIHANQGTDTALWIGDSSTNRYLAINEQGSTQNFNHIHTRFNDNAIHAHYILENPYAAATGYGSQILFRGYNQETSAYLETSNEETNSGRATFRIRGRDNHGLDVRSTGEVTTTHASNIGYETNAATNTRSLVYTSLDPQKRTTTAADWYILKTFYPNKSGRVNIHADMYITSGTYYFSFRVREEGTNTIVFNAGDNGGFQTYENPSGQSGNVHSYKTYKWICPLIKAHKRYYIEMAATNAAGTNVNANASQQVFLKGLYIYSMSGGHSEGSESMLIQQSIDESASSSYGGTTRAAMSGNVNRDSLNSIQYFAGTESTFLGWFTTRAYNRYLDFELNLSGSVMWFAQAYGYLYNRGQVCGSMISGYTYTNNSILNKYSSTFGTRGWYGSYRTSSGNLCLKFDSGANGYSEGRIALFIGTHGTTPSNWRVLRYRQNDTTNNIF